MSKHRADLNYLLIYSNSDDDLRRKYMYFDRTRVFSSDWKLAQSWVALDVGHSVADAVHIADHVIDGRLLMTMMSKTPFLNSRCGKRALSSWN